MPDNTARRRWIRRHGVFLIVLAIASILLTLNVRTPFWATHDTNGTFFTGVAANHLRLGLGYTKGQDVIAVTEFGAFPSTAQIPDVLDRYFHGETIPVRYGDHPPLLGLSIAGMIAVFGEHYTVVRMVPILYSLLGLILFYLLIVKLFDVGIARLATLIYTLFPLFAYFGRNVAHESPTLFFGLGLLTGYVWWRDGGPRQRWWAAVMVVSIVVGGCYGWPMFYLAALLFVFDWVSRRRFDLKMVGLTAVPAVLTFAAVIGQIAWAFGGSLSHLVSIFATRGSGGDEGVTAGDWFERIIYIHGVDNFGRFVVWVLPVGVAFVAYQTFREHFSQRTMIVTTLGSWGLLHILLFREGAFVHVYWQFYLLPFVALAIAWPTVEAARRLLTPAWLRSGAFVVAGLYLWAMNQERIRALYESTSIGVKPIQTVWSAFLS